MVEVSLVFVIGVFVAGILTFLAPCTLPLVPAFIGFISGVSIGDGGEVNKASRRRVIVNAVFYVIGFSLVFIAFGILAGIAGTVLGPAREILTRVGGAIVIIFGLYLMGLFKLNFFSGKFTSKLNSSIKNKGPLSSLAFGASFGAGWSPCVGPVVASVLLLTSSQGTVFTGALLLAVFSIGLGLPFLLTAVFLSRATVLLKKIEKHLSWINKSAGVLIVLLGVLLVTNNLDILIRWGFRAFEFLNYEELILNYL